MSILSVVIYVVLFLTCRFCVKYSSYLIAQELKSVKHKLSQGDFIEYNFNYLYFLLACITIAGIGSYCVVVLFAIDLINMIKA